MKSKFVLHLILILVFNVGVTGCGQVNFQSTNSSSGSTNGAAGHPGGPSDSGTPGNPGNPGTPGTPPPIVEVLKTLQPTLAVRGLACLMCHADIRSNIVTDFGYGHDYFLGGGTRFDDQSWYNNLASTWQTAHQIVGTVYVPDVYVTPAALAMLDNQSNPPQPMKLADFMLTPYTPQWNFDGNNIQQAMVSRVTPADANGPKVVSVAKVTIRAPSADEMSALDPEFFNGPVGFKRAGSSTTVQMLVNGTDHGAYVSNDPKQALDCSDSDILVNGSLFLRGLKIKSAKGCRIYVVGSVFIEDAIDYLDGGDSNLQITSSRAVVMGINSSRLHHRLLDDNRGLQLSEVNYSTLAGQVYEDALRIGTLRDAEDDYSGGRKTIDYSGLLLNAPMIHSRYLGMFKGTIVAEAAMFSLGAFHFEFDPVFTRTSVFPLLKTTILEAK